jgi:dihydrofolate reductase
VLDMSVSLDGYIADPDDFLGGDDGERLHKWADVPSSDGVESAMSQAKAAAGDRAVQVRGAYTGQRALEAGVLDEMQIHQVPVLLGAGRRMFDVPSSLIELEIVRVIDTPEATHIRYRVLRS